MHGGRKKDKNFLSHRAPAPVKDRKPAVVNPNFPLYASIRSPTLRLASNKQVLQPCCVRSFDWLVRDPSEPPTEEICGPEMQECYTAPAHVLQNHSTKPPRGIPYRSPAAPRSARNTARRDKSASSPKLGLDLALPPPACRPRTRARPEWRKFRFVFSCYVLQGGCVGGRKNGEGLIYRAKGCDRKIERGASTLPGNYIALL